MQLSIHEQNTLIEFAESTFKDLPKSCIDVFKNINRLPGSGKVISDDNILTLTSTMSLSLMNSYEAAATEEVDLRQSLSELIIEEYNMHLSEILLETLTNMESAINATIPQLLRYCKMEKNPIIIVSQQIAEILSNERSFIRSEVDDDPMWFYEFGKIRNLKIVVDPLQINTGYVYLIKDNIINYIIKPNDNDESFINYELSKDGEDLIALFKPVEVYYQLDSTGMNFNFFIIYV